MSTSSELRTIKYVIEKDDKLDLIEFYMKVKNIISMVQSVDPKTSSLDHQRVQAKQLSQILNSIFGKQVVKKTHLLTLLEGKNHEMGIPAADVCAVLIVDFVKCREQKHQSQDLSNSKKSISVKPIRTEDLSAHGASPSKIHPQTPSKQTIGKTPEKPKHEKPRRTWNSKLNATSRSPTPNREAPSKSQTAAKEVTFKLPPGEREIHTTAGKAGSLRNPKDRTVSERSRSNSKVRTAKEEKERKETLEKGWDPAGKFEDLAAIDEAREKTFRRDHYSSQSRFNAHKRSLSRPTEQKARRSSKSVFTDLIEEAEKERADKDKKKQKEKQQEKEKQQFIQKRENEENHSPNRPKKQELKSKEQKQTTAVLANLNKDTDTDRQILVETRESMMQQMDYILKEKKKTEDRIVNGMALLKSNINLYNSMRDYSLVVKKSFFDLYNKVKSEVDRDKKMISEVKEQEKERSKLQQQQQMNGGGESDRNKQVERRLTKLGLTGNGNEEKLKIPIPPSDIKNFRTVDDYKAKSLDEEVKAIGEVVLFTETIHKIQKSSNEPVKKVKRKEEADDEEDKEANSNNN